MVGCDPSVDGQDKYQENSGYLATLAKGLEYAQAG